MELKEIVKHFTTPKLMELCAGLVGERDAADYLMVWLPAWMLHTT